MFTPVFTLFGPAEMSAKPANLRTAMPRVTAWIDDLRGAFGADDINATIKAGIGGLPCFYASEGGHRVGTPMPAPRVEIGAADMVIIPKAKP